MEWREQSPNHVTRDASSNEQEDEQEALYRARIAAALGGDESPAIQDDGFMEPLVSHAAAGMGSNTSNNNTHSPQSCADALSQWDVGELSVLRSAVRSAGTQLWHTVRYHFKKVENGASGKDIVEWIMSSGFLTVAAQHEFKYGAEMSAALQSDKSAQDRKQKNKRKKGGEEDRELAVSFADAMLQRGMFFQLNRRDTFSSFRGTSAQLYVRDDPRSLFLAGQVDQPIWKQLTSKSKFEERLRQLLAGTLGVHESETRQMKTVYVEEYQIYNADAKEFVGKGNSSKAGGVLRDSFADSSAINNINNNATTFQEVLCEVSVPSVLGEEADHCEWVIDWEACTVSGKTDRDGWVYGAAYPDVLSASLSYNAIASRSANNNNNNNIRTTGMDGKSNSLMNGTNTDTATLAGPVSSTFDAKRSTCRLRLWKRPARVRPHRRESIAAMVLNSNSHTAGDYEAPGCMQSYNIPIAAQQTSSGRRVEANDIIAARPMDNDYLRSRSLPNANHKAVAFKVGTYSPGELLRPQNDLHRGDSQDDLSPLHEGHHSLSTSQGAHSLAKAPLSRHMNRSDSAPQHDRSSSHDTRVSAMNDMMSGKAGEEDALLKMLAETGRHANRRLARSGKLTLFVSHGDVFISCLPDTFLRVQVGGSTEVTESPLSRLTNNSKQTTPLSTPKIKPRTAGLEVAPAQVNVSSSGSHASFEWRFLCTCAVGNDLLPVRVSIHQSNSIGKRHCICEGFFYIPKDESEGKDTLIMDTPSWQQTGQMRATPFSGGTSQQTSSLQSAALSPSNPGYGGISLFGSPRKARRRRVDPRAIHAPAASALNGTSNGSSGLGVIHFVWQLDDIRVVESTDSGMSDVRESEHDNDDDDSNEDSDSAHSGATAPGYKSTPGISLDPTPGQAAHTSGSFRPSRSSSMNSLGVELDATEGNRTAQPRNDTNKRRTSPLSPERSGGERSREFLYGLVGSPTSSQGHRKNSYRLSTRSGRSNTQKSVRTSQSHGSTTASSVTVGALERLGCFLAAHPVRYVFLRVTVMNVELQYTPYCVGTDDVRKATSWHPKKLWFPITQDVLCPDPVVHKALQRQQKQDSSSDGASWLPWRRQAQSGGPHVFSESIMFKTLNRGEYGDQQRYSPSFDFALTSPAVQTRSHPVRATLDCDWSFSVSTTPSAPLKLSVWRKRQAGDVSSHTAGPTTSAADANAPATSASSELTKAEACAVLLQVEPKGEGAEEDDDDVVEDAGEAGREYCGELSLYFARELDEASFGAAHIRRFPLKWRESISASHFSNLRLSDASTSEECIAYATLQYQWVSDTLSS